MNSVGGEKVLYAFKLDRCFYVNVFRKHGENIIL